MLKLRSVARIVTQACNQTQFSINGTPSIVLSSSYSSLKKCYILLGMHCRNYGSSISAGSLLKICKPLALIRQASTSSQDFEAAQQRLQTLKESPGNQAKLKLYSLFKQATVGPVNSKRPGLTDFVGRAKWDAWNSLGSMSQVYKSLKIILHRSMFT